MMKNNIFIKIDNEFEKVIDSDRLKLCAYEARMVGSSSLCDDSLSISITNSENLKSLNKKFAGEDESTDVLSFPSRLNWSEGVQNHQKKDKFNDNDHLGDIFISYEKIIEHSKLFKIKETLELNIILAHGILHLLGYDHYDESSKIKINDLTVNVIKNLNLDYKKAKISLELRNE